MRFLFTKYKISTLITEVEAENMEEASKLIEEGGENIAWIAIPEGEFGFFSYALADDEETTSA